MPPGRGDRPLVALWTAPCERAVLLDAVAMASAYRVGFARLAVHEPARAACGGHLVGDRAALGARVGRRSTRSSPPRRTPARCPGPTPPVAPGDQHDRRSAGSSPGPPAVGVDRGRGDAERRRGCSSIRTAPATSRVDRAGERGERWRGQHDRRPREPGRGGDGVDPHAARSLAAGQRAGQRLDRVGHAGLGGPAGAVERCRLLGAPPRWRRRRRTARAATPIAANQRANGHLVATHPAVERRARPAGRVRRGRRSTRPPRPTPRRARDRGLGPPRLQLARPTPSRCRPARRRRAPTSSSASSAVARSRTASHVGADQQVVMTATPS